MAFDRRVDDRLLRLDKQLKKSRAHYTIAVHPGSPAHGAHHVGEAMARCIYRGMLHRSVCEKCAFLAIFYQFLCIFYEFLSHFDLPQNQVSVRIHVRRNSRASICSLSSLEIVSVSDAPRPPAMERRAARRVTLLAEHCSAAPRGRIGSAVTASGAGGRYYFQSAIS